MIEAKKGSEEGQTLYHANVICNQGDDHYRANPLGVISMGSTQEPSWPFLGWRDTATKT